EMRMGQCDAIVMLTLFWALAFVGRRPLVVGLLLGIANNIKYQGLILLPYLLVRKRWMEAISSIAWSGAIALSSAAIFGWQKNLDYLDRAFNGLKFVIGLTPKDATGPDLHPLNWELSISIPSVMARLGDRLGMGNTFAFAATGLVAIACFG